jgi:polysaccharide pyruvyl transferase WcaK-like protein
LSEHRPYSERARGRRRIALFNVKYSPNLGDGLLAECLEGELRAALPEAEIESLDLAGRRAYEPGRAERAVALSILHASPLPVRQAVSKLVLGEKMRRLAPYWRERLRGAEAVVIGGGNLVSDSDLNFPFKLRAAAAAAREFALPLGVYAVGVGDNWSAPGAAMFESAFATAPMFFGSVRDARSAEIWARRLGPAGVAPARVSCDPGLLAYARYPAPERPQRAAPRVGLGLMHPASLKYHADQDTPPAARQTEWTLACVRACLARGWSVQAFTNGSPEDEVYLRQLAPALVALDGAGRVGVEPRFAAPERLAKFIAGLDLLFAHRLHANIAAYSYGVPHIGFSWDGKLKSFLAGVGRGECLATMGVDAVEDTVALGARELRAGVERERRRATLQRAHADVAALAAALPIAGARRAAEALAASA